MAQSFIVQHRVEFFETDLAGIVHFANYYRFMEQAEHELFRALGLKIHERLPDGTVIGWPRVSAACSFESPAFYEDLIEIHVRVLRLGTRSLTTGYEFVREQQRLALGEMKTVCCRVPEQGALESIDIPAFYREQLTPYWIGEPEPPTE